MSRFTSLKKSLLCALAVSMLLLLTLLTGNSTRQPPRLNESRSTTVSSNELFEKNKRMLGSRIAGVLQRPVSSETVRIDTFLQVGASLIDNAGLVGSETIQKSAIAELSKSHLNTELAARALTEPQTLKGLIAKDAAVIRVLSLEIIKEHADSAGPQQLIEVGTKLKELIKVSPAPKGVELDFEDILATYLKGLSKEEILGNLPHLMSQFSIDLESEDVLANPKLKTAILYSISRALSMRMTQSELKDFLESKLSKLI